MVNKSADDANSQNQNQANEPVSTLGAKGPAEVIRTNETSAKAHATEPPRIQSVSFFKKLLRILTLLVAIATGVGMIAFFISRIEPPARIVAVESQRAVRVIETALAPFVVEASGFGSAEPNRVFSAVSNVKGHVIYRRDDLESGAVLPEGTLLLEIDPGFYELALSEADAEIASVEAEVAQLNQEAINADALLALEKQRLELAEISLERTRTLVASGTAPQASLDNQLRTTLAQRQAVQALVNQQNILPIQLDRLAAQKQRVITKRDQVLSDLADTKIFAPFELRVSEVNVEMHQYINPGQVLFSGDGTHAAEVVIQVPMQSLRRVLSEIPDVDGALDMGALDAYVHLVGANQKWDAQVIRIANGIDPATRTVRVVLEVEQPHSMADPVTNPPLPKGMFVQGVLQAPTGQEQLVVPQSALHQGWIYLVDEQNRLERRQVEVAYQQNGMAVILSGLAPGETVILDDIVPAISGQLLAPLRNQDTEAALLRSAMGQIQ